MKDSINKVFILIFGLIVFQILHFTLYIENCSAQWQPDVRLTNGTANSSTSESNAWCIASSGDSVHVVWFDFRDGNYEIYYKRSTDGGVSWGADTRLTNAPANSQYPSIAVSGSVVHVVWFDNRDGNYEIYYKRSTDGGVSWGADTRLSNNSAFSWNPCISVSGLFIHVVWQDQRDGNFEVYYNRSTDGGVSWGADTRLTNNSAISAAASISLSGSVLHVVWFDQRDGNYEIYYKRSTNGGSSWEADTRLTNNSAYSVLSSSAASGQVVHVVWSDERNGGREIYYKRSTDAGVSWGADTRLTNTAGLSQSPSISASGQVVHVVWTEGTGVYNKCSIDGGTNWESDIPLTSSLSQSPSIAITDSTAHVVWRDTRDGNGEIYYKRNPTANIVGLKNIGFETPSGFSLKQNYPNPFNPITVINYSVGIPSGQLVVSSFASLKVYDGLGKEVATLVNESQQPGTYEVKFDGSNYPSGVYFYQLKTEYFSDTKKLTLLK